MTDGELLDAFWRFAIALFIGALVGIDREKKRATEGDRDIAGLRTFILVALAGGLAAWLSKEFASPWIFAVAGLLIASVVIAGYAVFAQAQSSYGLTSEIAALVVYLLGGMAVIGETSLAVALAIAVAAVLAFKEPLHEAVAKIGRDDLYAALTLLICVFIVLPLLPNRTLDPWNSLNPYKMGWLVVLISGLSLVGYIATRVLGAGHGVPLTGLFGGLVSSTAVTLTFSRRSREEGAEAADGLAAGILLAWGVMFVRVLAAVGVANSALLRPLLAPMLGLGVISGGCAAYFYRRGHAPEQRAAEVPLRNPFSLASAIRFALLFALVMLIVALVQTHLPGRGVYAVAALAGLTDVDAITLSVATSARNGSLPLQAAANSIVVAAISNSVVKAGLVLSLAAPALKRRIAASVALIVVGAGAALFFG